MSQDLVLCEITAPIARITLNNPPVNAISTSVLDALHAALDKVAADPAVRCVIFTGAGEKAFCAGGDMRQESSFTDASAGRAFRDYGRRTLERLEKFEKPIVCAIHGYCIGGGTAIAWSCDIRIAADNTVFRAGDAYIGLIPSWGMGLLRLPRLVGRNKALDILLVGENFGAEEARDLGLVTKAVPAADLQAEAQRVAERIASASPTAISATRRALSHNMRSSWDEMARYEEELCEEVFEHPDAHEGLAAFLEKRPAEFKDL